MDTLRESAQELFILAVILVVLAYFVGATSLLTTAFSGLNQLGLTFTGRDSTGQFASYPANAPTSGT